MEKEGNFDYLRKPPALYAIKPDPQKIFVEKNGKLKRELFYNLPFTHEETELIARLKKFAFKANTDISDCADQDILRFLYSFEFRNEEVLAKLNSFIEWNHNPKIQNVNLRSEMLLKQGAMFTFGRDKLYRPVIVMDLTKINFKHFDAENYYSVINAVIGVVREYLFVPGVIEKYLFIIDLGGNNFMNFPMEKVVSLIKTVATVYSMLLGQMLIINAGFITKIAFQTIKPFIQPNTLKKIELFQVSELEKVKEFIDSEQLLRKFSGSCPDLEPGDFWPPRLPSHLAPKGNWQKKLK